MQKLNRLTQEDIRYFSSILGEDRVLTGDQISEDYAHDEMTEYGSFMPDAVLMARSTQEVSAILRRCNERRIGVTPRGAGTGLCGGCVALQGGVVLCLSQMKRLLQVDKVNMTATVEAGLLLMEFNKMLEGSGLFYPPDPGEKSATVCGNIMTNAGGMRAVRYGVTRDYVLGMTIVLSDGTVEHLGGQTVKTSSGYPLMQLLCGSEGTLCVLTEATVKLIPEPKASLSLLVPFDDLQSCVEAVPQVLGIGCEPTAVEFMEKEVIEAAETYLGKQFPDKSADAYLLLRLDGSSSALIEPRLEAVTDLLLSLGARDVLLADTDERKMSIWDARGAFLEAIKNSTPPWTSATWSCHAAASPSLSPFRRMSAESLTCASAPSAMRATATCTCICARIKTTKPHGKKSATTPWTPCTPPHATWAARYRANTASGMPKSPSSVSR